jgi:hypothetical protein
MPPKEYDLKGITLGFNGRATTLVANEIVNEGFWWIWVFGAWRLVVFT